MSQSKKQLYLQARSQACPSPRLTSNIMQTVVKSAGRGWLVDHGIKQNLHDLSFIFVPESLDIALICRDKNVSRKTPRTQPDLHGTIMLL